MSAPGNPFCLSSAAILRCPSFTGVQYIVIVIPAVIEVIFTSSLPIVLWNSGQRRQFLLTLDSWIYLLLSILDLISHVAPASSRNIQVFTGLDIAIGVMSFLPLLLYTFFLHKYANAELLVNTPTLPRTLAKVASLLLLIAIPVIIAANEVASFFGIRRIVSNSDMLIGFDNPTSLQINTFFSSLTLALLIVFQAIVFLIVFFRLITALMNQRSFQNTGRDAAHLINGVAWLSLGMKLGAIETTIGFAGGMFGLVITRRIIRFVGRACLCIGIIKGVDEIEDFRAVTKEMTEGKGRSKYFQGDSGGIRNMISNPRLSTFQQLSPRATEFYNLPRAHLFPDATFDYNTKGESKNNNYLDATTPRADLRSLQELEGITAFANLKEEISRKSSGGRVVVTFHEANGTPTLNLRFSDQQFPSPSKMVGTERSPFEVEGEPEMSESGDGQLLRGSGQGTERPMSDLSYLSGSNTVTLLRPNVAVLRDNSRDSMATSVADSAVEIVVAPQRKVSQKNARATLYTTTTLNGSNPDITTNNIATGTMQPGGISQDMSPRSSTASYLSKIKARMSQALSYRSSMQEDGGKFRIMSDYSTYEGDRSQSMKEIAKKFPGPPITYNGRPLMVGLQNTISSSPASVNALSGGRAVSPFRGLPALPPAAARPKSSKWMSRRSEVTLSDYDLETGAGPVSRFDTDSEYEPSRTSNISIATVGRPRAIVSNAAAAAAIAAKSPKRPRPGLPSAALSSASVYSSQTPSSPFDDKYREMPGSLRPGYRPSIAQPQPGRRLNITIPPVPPQRHTVSVPTSPESIAPLSAYTAQATDGSDDPFEEKALRTGSSGQFSSRKSKRMSSVKAGAGLVVWQPGPLPTPVSMSGTITAVFAADRSRRPPSSITWKTPANPDVAEESVTVKRNGSNSSEEVHRRQKSIDAAAHAFTKAIPWLRNQGDLDEEEKKLVRAMSGPSVGSSVDRSRHISRIKTVGQVKHRITPPPTRRPTEVVIPGHSRVVSQAGIISGFLHGFGQPEFESPISPTSATTATTALGGGVKRDSELLGTDDATTFQSGTVARN
ncbi:hypothetical protein FA15DRAFT_700042 [Coprinopsis marcescibilis]|uniref:Uncharacterized protein n=1 Tax=Coprinopsis marcescibilis TaxID=230819 RepID=A0A5C3L8U3_COPMA|nr:hypothetical protein FA15DRAFT_700042 [Coprinopsis marcescibilis]